MDPSILEATVFDSDTSLVCAEATRQGREAHVNHLAIEIIRTFARKALFFISCFMSPQFPSDS